MISILRERTLREGEEAPPPPPTIKRSRGVNWSSLWCCFFLGLMLASMFYGIYSYRHPTVIYVTGLEQPVRSIGPAGRHYLLVPR